MATTMGVGIGANIFKGGTARVQTLFSSSYSPYSHLRSSRSFSKLARIGGLFLSGPRPGHANVSPTFCTSNPEVTLAATSSPPPPDKEDTSDSGGGMSTKDAANMLDIRVGRIIKAWRHEEADSLYVEEVDVGEEAGPRTICSGLVGYVPIDLLQDRKVIVLANLKPRNMRGVKSSGMLLCASDSKHENVELLEPPEGSLPGERVWFGDQLDKENQSPPATPNQIQKKKIWELVQPHLKTNDSCFAMLGEDLMQTSAGAVVCKSLKNANIS